MIKSFDAKNFRCFEHVALTGLKRINIVTGANGTGKSALLEAIYLGGNATAAALQNINSARALTQLNPMIFGGGPLPFPIGLSPQNAAASFDHLFRSSRNKDFLETAKTIEIRYEDTNGVTYYLGIAHQGAGDQTPVPVVQGPGGVAVSAPLIFDRTKRTNKITEHSKVPISVNQFGQLAQPFATPFGPTTFVFGPSMDYAEVDNVTWFSQLKERNQAEMVINFVRQEFPFVKDIEILAPAGANGLYATMLDGTRRRVTVVSAGINKIISILLACAHTRDGIIVIDEIENGIFYEKYGAVWQVLYKFATDTGNQIFTTSHSAECLRELAPVVEGHEDDFGLLRTERDDSRCIVHQISGAAMKSALKRGGEIRGATLGTADAHH